MTSSNWFVLAASLLIFLWAMASMAQGTVSRLKAGPIRFRLPLASMGATHPWSRVVVKHWQECDGAFAVRLTIVSSRLFGTPYARDVETIVPVPGSDRPALGAFLAEHAANTA